MTKRTTFVICLLSLFLLAAATTVNLATQVTGQLATANGGTGQNSSAVFPTSGTVSTRTQAMLIADNAAITGTSLTSVTGLSLAVAASTNYAFQCTIYYTGASTSGGLKFGFTVPASPGSIAYSGYIYSGNATTPRVDGTGTASAAAITGTAVSATTTVFYATSFGNLQNGTTAGSIQFQAASITTGTSNGVVIKRGSFCNFE